MDTVHVLNSSDLPIMHMAEEKLSLDDTNIQYSTLQYNKYNTVQYNTILYNTKFFIGMMNIFCSVRYIQIKRVVIYFNIYDI